MKALSIQPDYALMIATGFKTVEVRTWKTDYRGDVLICSTSKKIKDTIPGHALCVVKLVDVVPMKKKHCKAAAMSPKEYQPDLFYAWILEDARMLDQPIPVKGKLSLWNYDGKVDYTNIAQTPEEIQAVYEKYWEPLFI